MNVVHIRFNSREDQVKGFYELATRARVTSLRGGIYSVPMDALRILDEQHGLYRRATDEEVEGTNATSRNLAAAVLQ